MSDALLVVARLALLAGLYLFLWRVTRIVTSDLRSQAAPAAPGRARPRAADVERRSSGRRREPRQLVVHHSEGQPETVELDGRRTVRLGRARSMDVPLADEFVSDEHAEVSRGQDGTWRVRDLGSTNGTLLNDGKVMAATPLSAGDRIKIGRTTVEVRR